MHILLKSRMRKAFPLGGMLLSVLICSAAFDASDGYVTLGKNEFTSAANFSHSLTTAGSWSDGRPPHPDTNYYAAAIGFYPNAKFEGGKLVVSALRRYEWANWATFEARPCEIPDLQTGTTASSWTQITQLGMAAPIMLKGRLTVLGTLAIYAGPKGSASDPGGWFVFANELVGDTNAKMVLTYSSATIAEELWHTGSKFIGKTAEWLGLVEVKDSQTLVMGAYGFPNAKEIVLSSANASVASEASAGTVVPLSRLVTKAAATVRIPFTNSWRVASLDLAAGTRLDCGAASADALADGGIEVTEALTFGGKLKIDLGGASSLPCASLAILRVPVSVKTLTADDFELVNCSSRINAHVQIKVDADACAVYVVRKSEGLPSLPYAFDEANGYVVLTNSDVNSGSDVPFCSFSDGGTYPDGPKVGNWSDGYAPHAGAKYCQNGKTLRVRESGAFAGDRLVQLNYLRVPGDATVQIDDWWLLPNGKTTALDWVNKITSEGASFGRATLKGRATFFTTEQYPFKFEGGLERHTWQVEMDIVGEADAGILCAGTSTLVPGEERRLFNVNMIGEASGYYGTVLVSTNATLGLAASGLPNGCVKALTRYATVRGLAAADAVIPVCELVAEDGMTLDVPSTNAFRFGSLAVGNTLVKKGACGFAASGIATVGANAKIEVSEGRIQALSEDAFNGFDITFADGAGFTVDAEVGVPLRTSGAVSVMSGGTVRVNIMGFRDDSEGRSVIVLAKVPASDAQRLADSIWVKRIRGFAVSTPRVGDADENGLAEISVEISRIGLTVVVR